MLIFKQEINGKDKTSKRPFGRRKESDLEKTVPFLAILLHL